MQPLEQVQIGGTAVRVTRLGLGTAPLGGLFAPVSAATAEATIAAAWDSGIRFFDTAPLYGHGLAEMHLGRALANKRRDDYVLATKVGRLLVPATPAQLAESAYKGVPPVMPEFDFSYDGVMRSLDASLTRLKLDRVDILHIHDPDDHHDAAIASAYKALARLRADGTIRAVGAGMNQWQMLRRFADEGEFDCFLLAGRYTLLEQDAAATFLPRCAQRRISVIAAGVYNSGLLADPRPGATYNYREAPPALIDRARRIGAVCAGHGVPLKAAAIQFPAAHAAIACTLTGARDPNEFMENLAMTQVAIPADLWRELRAEGLLSTEASVPG